MRHILYIVAFVFCLLSTFSDANKAAAQNITLEWLEPFWDAADPDGYYYAEPCDVCGEFIG